MVSDKNNRQSPVKSSNYTSEVEGSEENHAARRRQKLLCELDSLRRHGCQEKIKDIVVRVQQSSHCAVKLKVHQQENVWLASQARFLKEEEEIYHKLHEEEEESKKRQEQMVYEHEQHSKRVNEISKIIIRVEERERENEERNKQLHLHKRVLTEKCHAYVSEYRTTYERFLELLKTCKDKRALGDRSASNVTKLRSLSELMNLRILEKCKNIAVNDDDLHICARTVEEAKQIVNQVEAEIVSINKEYDQAIIERQKKDSNIAVEAAAQPPGAIVTSAVTTSAVATSAAVTPVSSVTANANIDGAPLQVGVKEEPVFCGTQALESNTTQISSTDEDSSALKEYVSECAFKTYNSLNLFREKFSKSYESLVKDEGMKKFRFECQKAVNTPVNAIAPVNPSHLQDKFTKLQRLLCGQTVEVGRSHFSAAQHPQGIAFCKDLLAKKFVGQGEITVSCKPEAAFAIAAVIVSLWSEFPDFGQLLLAHFYKECPYLVPFFKPQLVGQSDMDYYKSLGYHYSDNGEVEKQDKFLKRMSGIMHLYCAIIVTPLKRHSTKPHPMGYAEAWRWIACVINLDPRPDICATLLYEFLEVVGHFMYICYGQIFQKVLHLLCTEYYHKLEEVTPSLARGPVARLETFLQKVLKQGRINPPTGLLPIDFW